VVRRAAGDRRSPARRRPAPSAARPHRLPRTSDVASPHWPGPSARTLARRFGGVAGAWRALGPVPDFDGASALRAAAGPATELALVGALADLIRPRWSRPGTERRTGAGPPDMREPGGP
jgi:hypothetical protein